MAENMFIENSLSDTSTKITCLLMDQEQSLQGEGISNWCESVCSLAHVSASAMM